MHMMEIQEKHKKRHTDGRGMGIYGSYTEAFCHKSEIMNVNKSSQKPLRTQHKMTLDIVTQTSEHGGQSPSQQRRLQACRPQSLIPWHFLSHAKS